MKRLSKVIYEVNGKDTFVKVKNNSFEIEKAVFSFVKYEEKSKKLINSGDYYLDFASCLSLYRDIDKGLLQRDVRVELERIKKENQKYAKPVRQYQGGITEEKAGRKDGHALARILSIEPGSKYPYILKYTEGPAKTDAATKLITPLWWSDKNYKADFQILVPCSEEDITKMALMLMTHIQSYVSFCYHTDEYMVDYDDKGKQNAKSNKPSTSQASRTNTTTSGAAQKEKSEAGETSEKREMEILFDSIPSYIEGTDGLYISGVKIGNKKLDLYYTSDVYNQSKSKIEEAYKAQTAVKIKYVIVKDPNDKDSKYTYFMGFVS